MVCLTLNGATLAQNRRLLQTQAPYIEMAELRADFLAADEWTGIEAFAREQTIPLILTWRRPAEGGIYDGEESRRMALLQRFAPAFAYVDYEHDLNREALQPLPATTKVLRSYHSFQPLAGLSAVRQCLARLRHRDDEIPKLALMSKSLADTTNIFIAASEAAPKPQVVLAMSDWGEMSRVLYRRFGSLWTYACADEQAVAPGQISASQLTQLYRANRLNQETAIFAIVGNPVSHSASPSLHNPAFQQQNLNAVYIKIRCAQLEELKRMTSLLNIRGLSLTTPHKREVIPYLASRSPTVAQTQSCNTVLCRPGGWQGHNTDGDGVTGPLQNYFPSLKDVNVVIIGAGGAAQTAAVVLQQAGAQVLILNRTSGRAQQLAAKIGCRGFDLDGGRAIPANTQVLLQASSAGLDSSTDPIPDYHFSGAEVAFEMIYQPAETSFLRRAKNAGCVTIRGRKMLAAQAVRQKKLFLQACRE